MKLMKLTCLCFMVMMVCISTAFAYDNRPIVVLREGDAWANCRDVFPEFGNKSFLQYAKQLQMPITWGVITNCASIADGSMGLTWAELIDYVNTAGGELASHSASHEPMSSLQAYVDDLLQSKAAIQANTPFTCNTFLQPGTWTGNAYFDSYGKMSNILGQAIQSNFTQSQLYFSGRHLGVGSPVWKHGTEYNTATDYQEAPVTSDLLQAIDYISQIPGAIYIIAFHGIQSSTNIRTYCTRADLMADYLTKLAALREAGLIRIASMNDAFNNNQFAPDINRVFDTSFELYTSDVLNKYTNIWEFTGGAAIIDQIGYNNSKCCRIVMGGKAQQMLYLPSGRYKLSWIQKPDSGTIISNNGLTPYVFAVDDNTAMQYNIISFPSYRNTAYDWEEKNIILKIPDNANRVYYRQYWFNSGAYLMDDVSMKKIDTDPNECVSGFTATPTPSGIQLNWRSPDNSVYKKINLRYSTSQCSPQTLTSGTLLKELSADNGNQQSYLCPFSWSGKSYVYLSAFAVKMDNTYSEPDVDMLMVDQASPVVTNLTAIPVGANTFSATWLTTAKASSIYTTKYSVGTAPSSSNIIGWTTNNDGTVEFGPLTGALQYYLNVKTQNIFGVWSGIACVLVRVAQSSYLFSPDGTTLSLTGNVSAIFKGCYYIQFPDIMRGIKVVGPTNSLSLGMTVTAQGTLRTDAGERYIDVHP
ncbi:MAG: hypothetical protein NT018_05305 [Armatimonadetes bacterium]|nr:hypothetical protein [Armatimonadota bacterium]